MERTKHNYFRGQEGLPFHLSIGAIVYRDDGKILCHHFIKKAGFSNLYILMRETLNKNESIEKALTRGLKEEFNVKAQIIDFLGTIVSSFTENNRQIEKTTIYFLCKLVSDKSNKRDLSDLEGDSQLEWLKPKELIKLMKKQLKKYKRTDLDESSIIKKVIKYL